MITLDKQRSLAAVALSWFRNELEADILDSRRRYDMILADAGERKSRDLSTLPSTKSTAVCDKFVESAINTYEVDPDAYQFSAKSTLDPAKDANALWLTEIFKYRKENCGFSWFTWHMCSLTAGAIDGLEAGLVYWRKESYEEEATKYYTITANGPVEVPKEAFDVGMTMVPEMFYSETGPVEVNTRDTFWIDQLVPGVEVFWDPNIPLLDPNLGTFALVKLWKTVDELKNMAKLGQVTLPDDATLESYLRGDRFSGDSLSVTNNPRQPNNITVNLESKNSLEVWQFFSKEGNRWFVQFSLGGQLEISEPRTVDDVYFGGSKFNVLPFALGATRLKPWKAGGRSFPKTISSLEDQHIDHINAINDAVKISIQGRYRIDPGSNIKIDDLLHRKVFMAEAGEYERIEDTGSLLSSLRVDDTITASMNEIIPVGLVGGGRGVVPKGTDKTLGAVQLGKIEGDEKMGVSLKCRNETFMKKILKLIVLNIVAFDTDDDILRKAAENCGITAPSYLDTETGQQRIDNSALDAAVDVVINAGLGASPRYKKAQDLIQMAELRQMLQVPTNNMAIAQQLAILGGYAPDQFDAPPPQPVPPEVKYAANVAIDFAQLPDMAKLFLMKTMLDGGMSVTAKVDDQKSQEAAKQLAMQRQNGTGGAPPDRMTQHMDSTGDAGMAMSEGGQNG